MRATSRSALRLDRSSSPPPAAADSAPSQSTGPPSDTEPASESRRSSVGMAHDLRELAQRAPHGHPCRVPARPIRHRRDLLVAEIQLDAEMKQPALLLAQTFQRALVPLEHLRADRALEGRGASILYGLWHAVGARPPSRPSHLIADTVQDRLANIGLEPPRPAHLDPVQPLDCLE